MRSRAATVLGRLVATPVAAVWLLWRGSPALAVLMLASSVAAAAAPVAAIAVTGRLVAELPAAGGRGSGAELALDAGLLGAAALVTILSTIGSAVSSQVLGVRLTAAAQAIVLAHQLRPAGIAHLEDPDAADIAKLALGDRVVGLGPPNALPQVFPAIVTGLATAAIAGAVLGRTWWWMPPVLIVTSVVQSAVMTRSSRVAAGVERDITPRLRRAHYVESLAVEPEAAREVRVFGLAPHFLGLYRHSMLGILAEMGADRRRFRPEMVVAALAGLAGAFACFLGLAGDAAAHRVGVSEVVVAAQLIPVVLGFAPGPQALILWAAASTTARRLRELRTVSVPAAAAIAGQRSARGMPAREIAFEGVRFTYPGASRAGAARPVFDGLDMVIEVGRCTAIVGLNGAGKTTLLKLLARLYDPDAGRVAVDGMDLRELDPASWRSRLAVIFQDFARWPLSLRDNVDFAGEASAEDLDAVAEVSGAAELVRELPRGWETVLTRQVEGGEDLSGGQWQRVALARALVAAGRAGVVILDEPTAALDVRSETEIFESFLERTRGLTTLLVTHRLSSVRRADRIHVVEAGRVVESGTHAELMRRRGGRYARLFRLQASMYAEVGELA